MYLIHTDSEQNKVWRDLSSCITEKFSDFQMVRALLKNKLRSDFKLNKLIVFGHIKQYKQKIAIKLPFHHWKTPRI